MSVMGVFDDDTEVVPTEAGRWAARLTSAWDIGETANGGYALSPVLRAISESSGHDDPLSVTTNFLRPVRIPAGTTADAEVVVEHVRQGRTTSVARGTLRLDGTDRLAVLATFGDLGSGAATGYGFEPDAPEIPAPDDCTHRSQLGQGVELPILDRLDVRIHPDRAVSGGSDDAVIEGWIRFVDEADPSPLSLLLFADAFPPSLYPRLGQVGWVPSIELTVHVRRRPAPGWIQARFECDDLIDGRMIETGTLWDSSGAVVARSRQLGLLLTS